jgi:hypothetical protein
MAISADGSSVATSKPKINAYIREAINKGIEAEADKEERSKSQMIELLLKEALIARGYEFPKDEKISD